MYVKGSNVGEQKSTMLVKIKIVLEELYNFISSSEKLELKFDLMQLEDDDYSPIATEEAVEEKYFLFGV